jgi:hypothetical protein
MQTQWPLWRRLLFRFFFIYLAIATEPWTWLDRLPWVNVVTGFFTKYYYQAMEWAIRRSNDWFFHVKTELVMPNGSGDTSFGWASLWFSLSISFIGMIAWSLLQRQKKQYTKLNYWLCLFTRYYVSLVLFLYGIIKLFGMQMVFPSYSQLATPLGDLLPMRFSWLFIGYSTPYQFFSGLMETIPAILLLYRRTTTLGVLLATGVFLNVAVLNLSYDIPVKIFSMQMVLCCLFLLANESERILCFFVYNRPANVCTVYHYDFPKKWMKISRVVLKILFVIIAVGTVVWDTADQKKQWKSQFADMPFAAGMYDVTQFVVNKDTISQTDSMRWQNLVFDNNHSGSIATADTAFTRRYHRAYFQYKVDTSQHSLNISKATMNNIAILHYRSGNDDEILFWGQRKNDSIFFTLKRNPHHFQLAEKQFHWLSEANR